MKIPVILVPSNTKKEVDLKSGSTVADLLTMLCLKPDTVIVLRNRIPIPVDETIEGTEELKIVQVASGG